jgi:hypothetical protein
MGINIIPKYLIEQDKDQDGFYWIEDQHKTFDTLRCAGDLDFVTTEDIKWHYCGETADAYRYKRPDDFERAKDWVEIHIGFGSRLIPLLDEMAVNPNLWIFISW